MQESSDALEAEVPKVTTNASSFDADEGEETEILVDDGSQMRPQSYVRDYQTDNDSRDSDFDSKLPLKPQIKLPNDDDDILAESPDVSQRIKIFSNATTSALPSPHDTVSTAASTPSSQHFHTPSRRRRKRIETWICQTRNDSTNDNQEEDDDDKKSRRSYDGLLRSVHGSDDDDEDDDDDDAELAITTTPTPGQRQSRQNSEPGGVKIPKWINDSDNLGNRSFHSSSHSLSDQSIGTRSAGSNPLAASSEAPKGTSSSHGLRRGRRNINQSWKNSENSGFDTHHHHGQASQQTSPNAMAVAPSTPKSTTSVPASISYSGSVHWEQDDGAVALIKDDGEGLTLTPSRTTRWRSSFTSVSSHSPKSMSRSTRRSVRSMSSASMGSLLDSDIESTDEEIELATSEASPWTNKFVTRISKLKEREKKLRSKAKERMHQLQTKQKEERDVWKASLVELERVKRERDRLVQDQVAERSLMNESEQAAKRLQEDLDKMQKDLDLNNTCKSNGGTEVVKNALDVHSKLDTLLQENRRLQADNERLHQQHELVKEKVIPREGLANDDSELTWPQSFLKQLNSVIDEQQQITQHLTTGFSDNNDPELHSAALESKRNTCQERISAAFQDAQHSIAIKERIAEIFHQNETQRKAIHLLNMEHRNCKDNLRLIEDLKDQVRELEVMNAQDAADADRDIQDLKRRLEQKENENKGIQIILREKEAVIVELRENIEEAALKNHVAVQQIENLKSQYAENVEAISLELEKKNLTIQRLESQIEVLVDERKELETACSQSQRDRLEAHSEIERLKTQLEGAMLEVSTLKGKNVELSNAVATKQVEIDELKTERDEERSVSSKQIDEVRAILKHRKDEVMSLRSDLHQMKEMIIKQENGEMKIKEMSQRHSDIAHKLASLQERYDETVQKHCEDAEALHSEIAEWKAKFDSVVNLEGKLVEIQSDLEHRTSRARELQQEVDDLNALLSEQAKDITDAEKRITGLEDLVAEEKSRFLDLQKEYEKLQEAHSVEITNLEAQIREWKATCGNLEQALKEGGEKAEKARIAREEKAEKELEETMTTMAQLQGELKEIQSNHDALKAEVLSLSKERSKVMEANDAMTQKMVQLEEEVKLADKAFQESESGKYRKENEVLQHALERIVAEYQSELTELETKNADLMRENENQKKDIENLETEVMRRSLNAAKDITAISAEALDSSTDAKHEQDWAELSECFENLEESFRADDLEETKSIRLLEAKFQDLQKSAQYRDAYLMETIRRQKVSIDSMFEDLVFAQNQAKMLKERLSKVESSPSDEDNSIKTGRLENYLKLENSEGRHWQSSNGEAKQADMLQSLVSKQGPKKHRSNTRIQRFFGAGIQRRPSIDDDGTSVDTIEMSMAEEKCQKLEAENMALKSNIVQLQSKYKEEVYKHKKAVEELQLTNDAFLLKNMALSEAVEKKNLLENDRGNEDAAETPVDSESTVGDETKRDTAIIVQV